MPIYPNRTPFKRAVSGIIEPEVAGDALYINSDNLVNATTVVVGKSGAVDYLTTDYASDNACIQAAIDYVDGLGGGSILIREGTYNIISQISIPSNIWMSGVGDGTILKRTSGINMHCVVNSDVSGGNININLSNFKIDGNASSDAVNGYHGIRLEKVNNVRIHNMTIIDMPHHCINVVPIAGSGTDDTIINYDVIVTDNILSDSETGSGVVVCCAEDVVLSGNISSGMFLDGLQVKTCNRVTFENNEVREVSRAGLQESPNNITNSTQINFIGNNVHDVDHGILSYGNEISIIGNTFDTASSSGMKVKGTNVNISGNAVKNSTFYGINGDECSNLSIIGNICTGNTRSGIIVYSNGNKNTIIGNIIKNSGAGYPGIFLNNANENIVSENNCYDDQGVKTQTYGVRETGTSDYNMISNNNVRGNLTAGIIVVGSNTRVMNNLGYNPIGTFTAPSVPASTVNYTNAYGYPCQVQIHGGTVTEIDIDDIATGLTSGIFILPPGGTINITYSAVPSWRWWGL